MRGDSYAMRIVVGSDHAGFALKGAVVEHLRVLGHSVLDVGHHGSDRADYPIYGKAVADAVVSGSADRGIAICGSGVGISIAANKVRGIRCVCCTEPYSAQLSRQHNDSNVLALGARVVGTGLAMMIVDAWLGAQFEGGGRHAARLALIGQMEGSGASPRFDAAPNLPSGDAFDPFADRIGEPLV